MRFRRALVTGALIATFVVGGSGAAMAATSGSGRDSCGRGAHEVERMQKKLSRLSNGDGHGGRRETGDKLAARKAKLEQRLASAQAACTS